MSADIYADQVANIQSKLAQLQDARIENYSDLANTITEKYNQKMQGYEDKWKAVQDTGTDELAGLLGVKGIYKGGKKLLQVYRGLQERQKARGAARQARQAQDVEEGLDPENVAGPDELPDEDEAGNRLAQGDDELDETQDWYNEDGQKYFTGSEAEHDEYYKDDGSGELKDPTNIPEGHNANNNNDGEDEDDFDEDAQNIETDAPDVPQMLRAAPADNQGEALDNGADTEGGDSYLSEGFRNPFGPALDPPAQPAAAQMQDVKYTRTRFAQSRPDIDPDDPFQPTSGQPISRTVVERAPVQQEAPEPQELTTFKEPEPEPEIESEPVQPPDVPQDVGGDIGGLADEGEGMAQQLVGGAQAAVRQGVAEAGDQGASLLARVGQKAFTSLAQRGQAIREGFSSVKNFFSGGGGEALATEGGETAAAAGGEALAGLGVGDAVLGAIPVVGEVGLAVSGLVAIGEGLYHLFHHPDKPPAPPAPPPLAAPTALTQKYSLALPSIDSSIDRAASVSSF